MGGGLEVRLFFLGLLGESGEPPVPGLKSAVRLLLLVTAKKKKSVLVLCGMKKKGAP